MRKLILKISTTLDGFVGGPSGELDWLFASLDQDAKEWIAATLSTAGVHIMGSRTYADMAAYWPASTDALLARPMNDIPKVVFSRTKSVKKDGASWGEPRVASGDLAEEIARLKAEPGGDIVAHGGARFARSLVASDLIDEYQLVVHPVALGRGLALFSDLRKPLRLMLVSTTKFAGGAIANVLRPAR